MLIIVQVERLLCLMEKRVIRIFSQTKYVISLKISYIILKLVRSTIRIFSQPHSTQSVSILYCSLLAHVKYL